MNQLASGQDESSAQPLRHTFLCPGFAKCGTSTLHSLLSRHPAIYMPAIKEPYMYFKKGYQWYMHRYYDKNTSLKVVGECSPTFSMAVSHFTPKEIAQHIYRDFGEIRLVFMLRNPVQKLDSWYRSGLQYGWIWDRPKDNLVSDLRAGFDKYVFSQFIWDGPGTVPVWKPKNPPRTCYPLEGLYYRFIQPFMELWPREKVKFVLFEDFSRDSDGIFREILDFIGVAPDDSIDTNLILNRSNRAPRSVASILAMKSVKTLQNWYYKFIPFISYEFCLHTTHKISWMEQQCVRECPQPPAISDEARTLLEWYYNDDVRKLEQLLGRDLGAVWFPDVRKE